MKYYSKINFAAFFSATFVYILTFPALGQVVAESTQDPEIFRAQYTKSLDTLRSACSHLSIEGTYLFKIVNVRGNSEPAPDHFDQQLVFPETHEFSRDGTLERLHFFRKKGTGQKEHFERMIVSADEKGFVLRRNAESSTFYIEFNSLDDVFRKHLSIVKKDEVDAFYNIGGIDLWTIIGRKEFIIKSVLPMPDSTYLTLTFEYTPINDPDIKSISGTLVLDTARLYAISSYDLDQVYQASSQGQSFHETRKITYSKNFPLPMPAEIFSRRALSNNKTFILTGFRSSSWTYESLPKRDFTLEGYNLGQALKPLEQGGRHFPYWLIPIAIIFLAIGVILKKRISRQT